MIKAKLCVVCGKSTKRVLFKGSLEEVFICSKACETQYFESLSPDRAQRLRSLQYLDEEIVKTTRYERNCWVGAALGLMLIVFGTYFTASSPIKEFDLGLLFFIIGLLPLTGGALATRYFSTMREKLILKKRQLS